MDRGYAPSPSYDDARTPSSSNSSRKKISAADAFEIAKSHHASFRQFLSDRLGKEFPSNPRSTARDKLTRLTRQQFQELSTDVFDELMRRNMNDKNTPFLPVRDDFHPKRNQARQKLATLPKNRFKDLASDVFYELERRFPELKEARETPLRANIPDDDSNNFRNESPYTPQPSQSSNIVPVKGMITVEKVEVNDRPPSTDSRISGGYSRTRSAAEDTTMMSNVSRSNVMSNTTGMTSMSNESRGGSGMNFASLDSLMSDLGNMINANTKKMEADGYSYEQDRYNNNRGTTSSKPSISSRDTMNSTTDDRMKSDYELRISAMRKRIAILESELMSKTGRKSQGTWLQQLEDQLRHQKKVNQQQAAKISQMQSEYDELLEKYHRQLEVADDIRQEVTALLEEIKELTRQNDELTAARERDTEVISQLSREVSNRRASYERKGGLRNGGNGVRELDRQQTDIVKMSEVNPSSGGVIDERVLVQYQKAIDNLLHAGRSDLTSNVLMSMKSVVVACKAITEDVESHQPASEDEDETLENLKSQLSADLTRLVGAAKNHAVGMGISPVSLLDAAARDLTDAVVSLVRIVGVKPDMRGDMRESELM
ncbi:uncharacterized protein VTP21DRAFT_5824 [Calcarisporiella thermophila]|uniref:uncharacterized protein n=1 Tax=Calcarisporiella thermophila TaxID=911321 RepID=UPI00374470AA